eukprot:scaffold763_cov98-Cylindrotheca_fusiformis.AAC.2
MKPSSTIACINLLLVLLLVVSKGSLNTNSLNNGSENVESERIGRMLLKSYVGSWNNHQSCKISALFNSLSTCDHS